MIFWSEAKRRCQIDALITATLGPLGLSSSGPRSLPASGFTPSIGKKPPVTPAPGRLSGSAPGELRPNASYPVAGIAETVVARTFQAWKSVIETAEVQVRRVGQIIVSCPGSG